MFTSKGRLGPYSKPITCTTTIMQTMYSEYRFAILTLDHRIRIQFCDDIVYRALVRKLPFLACLDVSCYQRAYDILLHRCNYHHLGVEQQLRLSMKIILSWI